MDNEDTDDLDLGAAIQSARANQEDDEQKVDVVQRGGLDERAVEYGNPDDLPYVKLLKAAVALVKTGELSMEEYASSMLLPITPSNCTPSRPSRKTCPAN